MEKSKEMNIMLGVQIHPFGWRFQSLSSLNPSSPKLKIYVALVSFLLQPSCLKLCRFDVGPNSKLLLIDR